VERSHGKGRDGHHRIQNPLLGNHAVASYERVLDLRRSPADAWTACDYARAEAWFGAVRLVAEHGGEFIDVESEWSGP
jgi:hypothetical protein